MKLIEQDLARTWPSLQFFHSDGPYAEPLREVLEAYVCYRPDVGRVYVQGMSFIAAMLLLSVDTPTAFICLANLLSRRVYFDFMRLESATVDAHLEVFDAMFRRNLPKLHEHFKREGVKPIMYLLDWVLTLFAKSLPLNVAARLYDLIFLYDERFIWRAAIGLLKFLQPRLVDLDFEGLMATLKSELMADQLDEDAFISCIREVV